jgi:D-alanyl-D-alanine carboxypeptidase (penicillin-binding protein 5/6)
LQSDQTEDGLSERYLDVLSLFNYGYDMYTLRPIAKKAQVVQTVNISNATRDTKRLDMAVSEDINILIKKENLSSTISPDIKLKDKLKAPIKKGDVVGTVTYSSEDITYTYDLIANNDVKPSYFFIIVLILIVMLLLFLGYLRIKNKKRKNSKKANKNFQDYIMY